MTYIVRAQTYGYCGRHLNSYAGDACAYCLAEADRDLRTTARLNAQRRGLDALSGRADLLDAEQGQQAELLRELSARLISLEEAHNRVVLYAEETQHLVSVLECQIAALTGRLEESCPAGACIPF